MKDKTIAVIAAHIGSLEAMAELRNKEPERGIIIKDSTELKMEIKARHIPELITVSPQNFMSGKEARRLRRKQQRKK